MNRQERTEAARKVIEEATTKGFMDCRAIVRALYPERFLDKPVRWEAAYRWLADAGVQVVYLAQDGDTDISKAYRTGCWSVDFPDVLAYKVAYYQQIALNDWENSVQAMVEQGISPEEAASMMPTPRPPGPAKFVDTARKATGTLPRREEIKVLSDAQDVRHESNSKMRAMNAIKALLSGSAPQRHLHIVKALPEWAAEKGDSLTHALTALVKSGDVVVTERDGLNWYSLTSTAPKEADTGRGEESKSPQLAEELAESQDKLVETVLRNWNGSTTKKGKAKIRELSAVLGFPINRKWRNRILKRMEAG